MHIGLHWNRRVSIGSLVAVLFVLQSIAATGAQAQVIQSDDFHSAEIDTTIWSFVDPLGDATLSMSGTNAVVYVPGGINHDIRSTGNHTPRLMQDAADTDFEVEVNFYSLGSSYYQGQGIIVQEDDDTYLRFDINFTPGNPLMYAAHFDAGTTTTKVYLSVAVAPSYFRVTRVGDTWEYRYSYDGFAWTSTGVFEQTLAVSEVGLYFLNAPSGSDYWATPAFAGNVDYFFNTASPIVPEDGGDPTAETPPVVDVWYGDDQDSGQLGVPQSWFNIVGTAWDTDELSALSYSLNSGPSTALNMGPDGKRLVGIGDFNVEIPYADLTPGTNELVITATDTLGEQTDHPVTIEHTDGVTWDIPYATDWSTAIQIADEACVVDGRWHLSGTGVRTDTSATGLDRMITLGDYRWASNYEIIVPITVHAGDLGGPSVVGFAVGWQGHEGAEQPRFDKPYEAFASIRNLTTTPKLRLGDGATFQEIFTDVQIGVRYIMKLQSLFVGAGVTVVNVKFYQDGTPEPGTWDITADVAPRDGSVVLVAHRADVTFGDVSITPLVSTARTLTTNVIGNGTIIRDPDHATYPDGTEVTLTAVPDNGYTLLEWSDGLSGRVNPATVVLASDTTVTATFVPAIRSDDFYGPNLDTSIWRVVDPVGDAVLTMTGTNAVVYVPNGTNHDIRSTGNLTARLLQDAPDTDFEVEAKFDSRGSHNYQGQGIIVQEDDDTYLRFDVVFTAGDPFIYAAHIDAGVMTTKIYLTVPLAPSFIRITRTDDIWTYSHSHNGSDWTIGGMFDQTIAVSEVGVFFLNAPTDSDSYWSTPAFVGNIDYFFNTTYPIVPEDEGNPTAETPPVVDVWYGNYQQVGRLGIPQRWFNIIGTVWDTDEISELSYRLNGGVSLPLSMGPDAKRLVGVGDFNAEISNAALLPGVNQLVITAIDTLGEQTDCSVTVEFFDGITWEMPYMTNWSAATQIADQACVVDGKWHLTGDGVRTDTSAIGYDRLVVLGDYRWLTDYEVTVPMTFHAGYPVGTGFGIAVGWHGHMENPALSRSEQLQPLQEVRYQAIGWVRDVLTDPVLHLLDNDVRRGEVALDLDPYARHIIKLRSEYISPTVNQVSVKIWEDGTAEPDWQLTDEFDPADGSVILIAHQADVTFGNVEITPLSSFVLHTVTANVVGNGTIERVPDYASYSDSSQVELTAVPDAGWVFDGWSDGLSGNDNPVTLTMVSDTTVTANFIPEGFKVKIQVAGAGTVLVDPDEERYADGDTVIITAVPGDGFYFYGWSQDHEGDANPDTIEVTSDMTIVATFFGVITGVDSPPSIKELTVLQNSPNPFTQKTDFQFGLPDPSDVEIRVYDVTGKRVFATRITEAPAGWNRYLFNGRDRDGKLLPSGVYFYRIQAKDAAVTNKMVILR